MTAQSEDVELEDEIDDDFDDEESDSSADKQGKEGEDKGGNNSGDDRAENLKKALREERRLRKEAERERDEARNPKKDPPQPTITGKTKLATRFYQNEADTKMLKLVTLDPSAKERMPEIEKVLKEKPYLLEMEDGIKTADEIAKGRLISLNDKNETKTAPKTTTTTEPPAADNDKPKPVSQSDYDSWSEEQRIHYEETGEAPAGKK